MSAVQTIHQVIPIAEQHRDWIVSLLQARWNATRVVSRGRVHHADQLPGFIALQDKHPIGLATYHVENDQCEVVTLDSLVRHVGIGSLLINAVKQAAADAGCQRVWLITTNDNLEALRFYQRRGFVLKALYPHALAQSRKLKPEIPLVGLDGIPLRDEIELEMLI